MARCKFKFEFEMETWECPLEALPGEEYCYWHKEEEGKEPDDAKLGELKENEIFGAFLRKAKLSGKDLQGADLRLAKLQGAFLLFAKLQGAFLLGADLQGAYLMGTGLQGAKLPGANLQGADLSDADLQGAYLMGTGLQGADLRLANLQGADLSDADLQGASLSRANLQEAKLSGAKLEGANLVGVRADSGTRLDRANLTYANLYHSYLDETKTLRNAKFEGEKEINEIVADFLKKGNKELAVLDVWKIKEDNSEVAARLLEEGLVRYVSVGKIIVFFDRKGRRVVENPENAESKFFQRLRKRRNSEEEENYVEISELNDLIEREGLEKYLYEGSVEVLYEASYEVYNNLYYFYIQSGKLEEALRMHYRRCEVRRKLLREKGWINRLRSWIFDFFILKLLTGYGVKISRPLIASALTILSFAFLFWLTNGIVKNVNGKMVAPDFFDYFYHSVITFTSLGYSNIQPNLAVGHFPQILAAAESILGALMMALLIFTITYRVSR